MQGSVEKVSSVMRRLTITVPANQVEEAYTKQIDRLSKQAAIKGFRPGKAPLTYIKQKFGEEARKEALGEVIQKALYEAISTHQLQPISTPQVEPKTLLADQPLEFVASFEVLPEIEKIQFTMTSIEKLVVDVKSEDIDYVISQLKKQSIKWHIVDREAKEQDRVVIEYYPIFEEKKEIENQVKNYPLELGSKTMLPGFEEGLIGIKAGEERTLKLVFPADFSIQERAGKPVDFVVLAKQVYEAEIPLFDEAFVQKLGVASGKEEDLKTQIKQSLEQERDRLVKEKLKEQVFDHLLLQNSLEVPVALVTREAQQIHNEIYANDQHHKHQHSEKEMAAFNEIAKKRVALGLLIAEYAKKRDLKVDPERVSKRIQEVAIHYQNPQEVVTWRSSKENKGGIEAQVMEDQVIHELTKDLPITDKVVSYAE